MFKTKITSPKLWNLIESTRKVALYDLETRIKTRETGERNGDFFPIKGNPGQFFVKPTVKIRLLGSYSWKDYAGLLFSLSESWGSNDFLEFVSRLFGWEISRDFDNGHGLYFWGRPDSRGVSEKVWLEDSSPGAWEDFIKNAPMPEGRKVLFQF